MDPAAGPNPTTREPRRFSIRLPRPLWIGLAAFVLAHPLPGCSQSDNPREPTTDSQRMQGAWEVVQLQQDGAPAADASMLKMVIIKDNAFAFCYFLPRSKKESDLVHRFTIDASQNPKRIELTSPDDGSHNAGIYELDDETLKVCWSRTDRSRPPTEFTADKGSDRRLLVLKRRIAARHGVAGAPVARHDDRQ